MQEVSYGNTPAPVKRRVGHRRKHRHTKPLIWSLTGGLIISAVCASFVSMESFAQPRLKRSFDPATNLVALQLLPGAGPLSKWTYDHARLRVTTARAGRAPVVAASDALRRTVIRVTPGKTVSYHAIVVGLVWPRPDWSGEVTAPDAPTSLHERVSLNSTSMTWNTTITRVQGTGNLPVHILGPHQTVVSIGRPLSTTVKMTLRVTAANGEIGQITVVDPGVAPVPVYFFGSSSGRRVYITIDDGWYPTTSVLNLMQRTHLPITAFLTEHAVALHMAYWRAFVAAGGIIEDHTVSHPWLTKISADQASQEWSKPVVDYAHWFGQTPTLGRPPFGASNDRVLRLAAVAGLHAVIMWSASVDPARPASGIHTWNRRPLAPGEIILLHWQPGLATQLQQIVSICQAQHLVPAPLIQGLPSVSQPPAALSTVHE